VKQIKVDDKTYELIKQIAEKRQLSMSDVVEEAINILLGGSSQDKAIKRYVDKYITLQYESKCSKCGKQLNKGDKARYILYEYEDGSKSRMIMCLDCDVESNPVLWKLHVKKREYEVTLKQFKSEIDKKIELLNKLEYQVKVADLKKEILQLVRDIRQYITNDQKLIELAKKLEELYNIVDKLEIPMSLRVELEREVKARANPPVKSHKNF
jgi:PHP family Zn ribbon phosphoesterase